MIDTVVLSVPQDKFQILDHDRFNPSTIGLLKSPYTRMGSRGFLKCTQNPTKKELREGNYKPRLTIIKAIRKGGYRIELKIEFSLPKLCFGNNFDELTNSDFERAVNILYKKLYEMGVIIEVNELRYADVSAIHYSKNLMLENHVSTSMILGELSKLDLSSRIDIGSEKFRNGGHAIHYKTNTRDIVFYDKVKDLRQAKVSDKRAVESDNAIQLNLFEDKALKPEMQVLRMEVRLGNKKEITKCLQSVNLETSRRFYDLFDTHTSKTILNHFWAKINNESYMLDFKTEGVFEFAENIKANKSGISSVKLLKLIGATVLAKEGGSRRLRSFLGYEGSSSRNKQWYNLKKQLKSLANIIDPNFKALETVTEGLSSFQKVRLKETGFI